jgi:transcriptional regulator with XRE-family HTH domain
VLRRIRRLADLSQRELAARVGISKSCIGAVESGKSGLDVHVLVRAAAIAGLRLVLLDAKGAEVRPMAADAVRDKVGRRFPAHLDTRFGDQDWWHGDHRYERDQPWYTFDRVRYTRDYWRQRAGTPDDHQLPRPGDSPDERRATRQKAARSRREEELRRRRESGEAQSSEPLICTCPPACDELEDWSSKPVHAPGCPCLCDVG